MLYALGDRRVEMHESCFVADSASVIGSVVLERGASVWFNATIRGDTDLITIGEESNVQDGAVLHTDEGIQLTLGRGVTVGHMAMLHGCSVGDFSLIGIGATILNRARIGSHCIVGAHALVTEGKVFPDRSLIIGVPARVLRPISDADIEHLHEAARHYADNARRYREQLVPMG
jgi:carbonic anhydrase/acetyltransferase-like protein (isoleucine patch superfamily)